MGNIVEIHYFNSYKPITTEIVNIPYFTGMY